MIFFKNKMIFKNEIFFKNKMIFKNEIFFKNKTLKIFEKKIFF